jgi:hypothetical protein
MEFDDMSDDFVENLKKPSAWLRILFMAGFVVALYVSGMILLVLMLVQILFSLLTGDDNPNLRRLGGSLAAYVAEILAFLTYNTQQKPFPFLPFPLPPQADREASETTGATEPPEQYPHAQAASTDAAAETPAETPTDSATDTPVTTPKRSSSRRKKSTATDEQDTDV